MEGQAWEPPDTSIACPSVLQRAQHGGVASKILMSNAQPLRDILCESYTLDHKSFPNHSTKRAGRGRRGAGCRPGRSDSRRERT